MVRAWRGGVVWGVVAWRKGGVGCEVMVWCGALCRGGRVVWGVK